jgi:hypothetical protein
LGVIVADLTGGMGLPKLARQIVELLWARGVDRASERVDKHLRPFSFGPGVVRQSTFDSENDVSGLTRFLSCRRLPLSGRQRSYRIKGLPASNWLAFRFFGLARLLISHANRPQITRPTPESSDLLGRGKWGARTVGVPCLDSSLRDVKQDDSNNEVAPSRGGEQIDDVLDGLVGAVVGGFESAVWAMLRVRTVVEAAVGKWSAQPFVEEQK